MERSRNSESGIRNLKLVRSFFDAKLQIFLLSLFAISQISFPVYSSPQDGRIAVRPNDSRLRGSDAEETSASASFPTPNSRCSTQDIKTLTNQLLQDLPGYANRTSQRARKLSRSKDLYTYVLVAGQPEFEPLTTDPGVYSPKPPQADGEDVQQVFFTTLERQYLSDRAVELQGFHWAFFTQTEDGWRLATLFTRIGDRTGKKPPTPPEETSDGIIAQAIETWLRDCRARDTG